MQIFQVDAFTTKRFTGNPATVIVDADGRSDAEFAAIAREFPHAETAFVLPPDAADHEVRVRFFNARKEAAFVGHATLAAHAVLLALGRRGSGVERQKSGTGIITVHAEPGSVAHSAFVEFRQRAPILDEAVSPQVALRVAQALGVSAGAIHEHMPTRIARMGSSRLLLALKVPDILDTLDPDVEHLLSLGRELNTEGFFAFAIERDEVGLRTFSRMFCPALGIPEDPVSGNAHAMLAGHLWDLRLIDAKMPNFIGHQGAQLRRPGQVRVRLDIEEDAMSGARIGGDALIVSEGRLL